MSNEFRDTEEDFTPDAFKRIRELGGALKNHIRKIVEDRSIVLTGDTDHMSIDYIINNELKNIDEPRKYDFEPKNVHEQDLLRSLQRIIPDIFIPENIESLERAIRGEEEFHVRGGYESRCYDCAKTLNLAFKGNKVHIFGDAKCEHNNKFTVEIDFPSGEVVFDDWPDRFSEAAKAGLFNDKDKESINYLRGQRKRTDGYAAQGIFHHCVGNTSPRLFYGNKTAQIQIGGGTYNEKTGKTTVKGLKKVGEFCTDLWWVTMIDKQAYEAMIAKLPVERDKGYYKKKLEVATIKPGRYRFTCMSPTGNNGEDEYGFTYATAEWIGEVDSTK
jgi:hypothetical protein